MIQQALNTLGLRRIAIDTYKENVAYMHRDCQVYRSEGFQALSKVEITSGANSRSVLAVLNVVDDAAITAPGQLGLSHEAFQQLGLDEGAAVKVSHAKPPSSLRASDSTDVTLSTDTATARPPMRNTKASSR